MVSNEGSASVTKPTASSLRHLGHASTKLRPHDRHGKRSKNGCLLCKSRKVKCGEERPSCKQCLLRGSQCRYPSHTSAKSREQTEPPKRAAAIESVSTRAPSLSPLAGPTPPAMTFSMREMRFFQHFLTSMPHALPIGNRNVWLNDVPQLAHQQNFLMHAMLALGASELSRVHPSASVQQDMLRHRGRAILGLKDAIEDTEAWQRPEHADAVLATCYSLTFQASHLPDALHDFRVFVQGCALATEKIRQSGISTSLNVDPQWPQRKLEAALQHLQGTSLDVPLIARAVEGIEAVLTKTKSPFCHAFGRAMQHTMSGFRESAAKGFLLSSLSYNSWYELGSGLLQAFQDPKDEAPIILGAYFVGDVAMSKIVIPLHLFPDTPRSQLPAATLRQMAGWVEAISATVTESQQYHLEWPNEIISRIDALLQGVEYAQPPSLSLEQKLDIIRNLETRAHMLIGEFIKLGSELTAWFEVFIDMMYHKKRLGTVARREGLPSRFSANNMTPAETPGSGTSRSPAENFPRRSLASIEHK